MATRTFDTHDLSRFLGRHYNSGDAKLTTMTSMSETNKGKWLIKDEEYGTFLDLLHDYLFVKKGRGTAFVEQPKKGEPKPLLIDLDFKYSSEASLVRTFTLEQIGSFCRLLVHGLNIFFGVTEFEFLRFFVTLRPGPYASGSIRKDGVHIMCPDIALVDEKQKVLRNWMMSQKAVETCFPGTGYTNPPDEIYDESMTRKQGWIFYGDSKPNIAPYLLAKVFKYTPDGDVWSDDTEPYTSRQLMELLSVRYNVVEDCSVVLEDARESFEAMKAWGETGQYGGTQVVETDPAEVAAGNNTILEALQALYPVDLDKEEVEMIRRFVMECLSQERADKYDAWIRLGWCLHNINPSEENFQLWMDFSARSAKSSGNNVAQLRRDWFNGWRKDADGPRLTERSLRHWAKHDNPEKYKEIQDEYLGEYIRQQIEPTHFHISELMKKMYGARYVAAVSAKFTDWFEYDDVKNMWRRLNQGIELRMLIPSEVAGKVGETATGIYGKMATAPPGMKEGLLEKQKKLIKVQMSLCSSGFCDSVMKMAVHQFYEADFQAKLNINGNLFACRNGMLELRVPGADGRDHVVFRDGRPEDYMSFLAGQNAPEMDAIEYKPYNAADPAQAEIQDFFAKLFPNPELRRYTLRLLASCLEGFNREQCFYIATGVGGNGKSKLVELMRMTFGDYQTALQSTVLTRSRPDAGAANPEMMAAKCRRFIYLQEPDDKEPLNTSRMKQLSGEDMVEARALYGDQEKFVIMGKLFMMCNRLPPVTTMDRGTWRRIRVIEFVSKFVLPDHPEYLEGRPNVFLIDPMMDKKLRSWREPFLALLVHIYETEYIPFGLNPVPAVVMKACDKYKDCFDIYARFKSERVREPMTLEERADCRNAPINTAKITSRINAWKKEARVELNPQDAIKRLVEDYGEPSGRKGDEWPMIKVFEADDLVLAWDAAHAANHS